MEDERGEDDYKTLKLRLAPVLFLTVIASGGGFVFGYYVGFIIAQFGVLTYDDSLLHEIVRTGLVGAILGAAVGGWANDCLGRNCSLLIADALIFIGAVLLIFFLRIGDDLCSNYYSEIIGNTFVALGVGVASMTSPLYISESSPPQLRDILVSINFIFYGFGKFIFLNLYNDSIIPSEYIIPLAGFIALSNFFVMLSFPESPMWLYKKDREDDAIKVLKNVYNCSEVGKELDALKLLIKSEATNKDELSYSGNSIFSKICSAWSNPSVRKQFGIGTCLQAAQQLVGINAVIYCIPSINRMIGFGPSDPRNDIPFMKISLRDCYGIPPIFGGLCCTFLCVVRLGKRRMLCWGIYCVLGSLLSLILIFIVSPNTTTEAVSRSESITLFKNNTCLSYITAPDADSWDCLTCLRASSGCGFCRGIHYNILGQSSGACLIAEPNGTSQVCTSESRPWSTKYCEYNVFSLLVFQSFVIYTFSYSGSLEIIPWIVNSRMYPTEVRGIYGGIAAMANWIVLLSMIIISFFFTNIQGPLLTFLLISLFSLFVLLLWFKLFVPENTRFFSATKKRE
ncbi:hypothetical protein MKW92_021699 [Papaver armeniacum]|nr:hypothetical protein MKW92_021699 [Papaver armeniacum]